MFFIIVKPSAGAISKIPKLYVPTSMVKSVGPRNQGIYIQKVMGKFEDLDFLYYSFSVTLNLNFH